MERYTQEIEEQMQHLYSSLSEKDSRRYAAVEAAKLGHGGVSYIAELFQCDPDTITRGLIELNQLPHDEAGDRIRKKGVDARQLAFRNRLLSKLRKQKSKKMSRVRP
jgi:hypothetical protein